VFGSCPRQTVKTLGTAVAVGRGRGVSDGMAVASGCVAGSPQAMMIRERMKTKDNNFAGLLDGFMGMSFFEENICQLYKQAAFVGGLFVVCFTVAA
jgi:hypothetical protein